MIHASHVKLMVDYNLKDPLVLECLSKLKALSVKTTIDCGFEQGTKDPVLVEATREIERLLLTRDKNSIDERLYPPCTHGGIIIIEHPRPTAEMVCAWMKSFVQSGKRAYAKGHVTYLNGDGYKIHTHQSQPITGRFK
jgi:hypothetical protein